MEMRPVKSSSVSEEGYDPETQTLVVKFAGGGPPYSYHEVTPEEYHALMSADSFGSHLAKHIKPKHDHSRYDS